MMERLTDKHWRNFDPWEYCGQDSYCLRGCHDQGGCTNGCIVPKLYCRLAAYEDAEQAGRFVVLPCGEDAELERDGHTFRADHWNHSLTAFRDAPETNSGKQVALFSIAEATVALAGKGGAKTVKDA